MQEQKWAGSLGRRYVRVCAGLCSFFFSIIFNYSRNAIAFLSLLPSQLGFYLGCLDVWSREMTSSGAVLTARQQTQLNEALAAIAAASTPPAAADADADYPERITAARSLFKRVRALLGGFLFLLGRRGSTLYL